jgi:hypothetical protein
MEMDDLQFSRENLRRELSRGLDLLAKASESESSRDDALAAATISISCGKAAREYTVAIAKSIGVEIPDNQSS